MPRSYRRFSREFKMQVVESILKGAVASQVAKANALHPEVVRKWVRDFKTYQKDAFAGRGKAYTDNAKVGELERQLGQMAAENLVLSLAAHQGLSPRARRVACLALASELAGTVIPTPYGMVRLTALFSRAFNIPRSAFYRAAQAPTRQGDARLVAAIKDILLKHPRYGYRQVTNRLRRKRIAINAKRTLRLMRSHDLQNKPLRRPKWRGRHAAGDLANLSQFVPTAPDQLWLTDITFVRLRSRWIYLAVLIDAFSRKCIGWAPGTSITTELTLEALRMALVCRRPKATLVHHSDRGTQYGSSAYQDALLERGLTQSFSRPGTPTDNPVCERFIGTLKREEIWLRAYVDFDDAHNSIDAFIRDYNQDRSHSSLGKRSPAEFERMHHQAALSQPAQAEPSVS